MQQHNSAGPDIGSAATENVKALYPLALFLGLFIGTGLFLTASGTEMAFYQLSATVAILPSLAWAVWMGRGSIAEKLNIMLTGAGETGIITMCMIYLLAGGFASVAKAIGGVDSTVNLGLSVIPPDLVLPGLFVIAGFISTAMGTSMGTIAAMTPIAVGVAAKTGISPALLVGTVVGGAMFGDNLSMISDTTIAATQSQGCKMSDKFRMNLLLALPAALCAVFLLLFFGASGAVSEPGGYSLLKVLPYAAILGMAVSGMNVFVVLSSGIVLAGAVGLGTVDGYTPLVFAQDIYKGFTGMHEILVLSMLVGGLAELLRYHGGLDWIINRIRSFTERGGRADNGDNRASQASIGLLAALADICTANNTVAIVLTGKMAKDIAAHGGVSAKRSASLLDIFSCVIQGIIPYGAQILLAGSIAGLSPLAVAGNVYYCYLLAIAAVAAIFFGFPREKDRR
jgi:Na+/H+ antiporter NhaC